MKNSVELIILPTNDIGARICLYAGCTKPSTNTSKLHYHQNQHLYTTISQDFERLEEGDWCIHTSYEQSRLFQVRHIEGKTVITECGKECWKDYCRKIIGTTDRNITYKTPCGQCDGTGETTTSQTHSTQRVCDVCDGDRFFNRYSPNLQQVLLDEFCNNNNLKWEVEYKSRIPMSQQHKYSEIDLKKTFELKITDGNLNVTSMVEKSYSKEDMLLAFNHGKTVGTYLMSELEDRYTPLNFEAWINKKL